MNYLLCCRSGRRVAVDVVPVTDAVGTFLPSPISSYFPAVSLYAVTVSWVGSSCFPGPRAVLCGCRIYSRMTFKRFQVFFFSHESCCRATVNKPHCRYALEVVLYWEQQQWGKGNGLYWIYLLSQIEITAWSDFHTSGGGYPFLGTAESFLQWTVLQESIHFSRK